MPLQHVTLQYACCRLFLGIGCGSTTSGVGVLAAGAAEVAWERERTLGYNPLEAKINPAWLEEPSGAFEAYFTAAQAFVDASPEAVRKGQEQACRDQRQASLKNKKGIAFDLHRQCLDFEPARRRHRR